jgi:hypothetical protein
VKCHFNKLEKSEASRRKMRKLDQFKSQKQECKKGAPPGGRQHNTCERDGEKIKTI